MVCVCRVLLFAAAAVIISSSLRDGRTTVICRGVRLTRYCVLARLRKSANYPKVCPSVHRPLMDPKNAERLLLPPSKKIFPCTAFALRRQRTTYTGLFEPNVYFQTPLISAVDGAILKSFDVVRAMICWFNIMYHKPWKEQNFPSILWLGVCG